MVKRSPQRFLAGAVFVLLALSCAHDWPPQRLAAYGLFTGPIAAQRAAPGVLAYDLNTPLFSDYAEKFRFVRLPRGAAVRYDASDVLELPVGTVIAKTFAYPDESFVTGYRLIETRILEHRAEGWIGLPYVWNAAQTEARLRVVGAAVPVSTMVDGRHLELTYRVPNVNQCKGCHRTRGREMRPIGLRIAQLNRLSPAPAGSGPAGGSSSYSADLAGRSDGVGPPALLARWIESGALTEAPPSADWPRYPVWNDPASGSLDERARVWLEINCAHCHNPEGPASPSNLDLRVAQSDPFLWGVRKPPVAAGRGSGDRLFDIVPAEPDRSILLLRLQSTDPGVMMPELGRSVPHEEGIALVREWIAAMPG